MFEQQIVVIYTTIGIATNWLRIKGYSRTSSSLVFTKHICIVTRGSRKRNTASLSIPVCFCNYSEAFLKLYFQADFVRNPTHS